MKALTYTLYLEQPLLATSQEGDPNSSRSFDYIPGSLIRGLLIARYRELSGVASNNLLADPTAARRFFSGATRFLNAYPLLNDRSRALPTPLSLRQPKSGVAPILNLADPRGRQRLDAADPTAQYRPVGRPFCAAAEGTVLTILPERTIAIHIQRDRAYGRARRGSGEVFRYDALAADQWFAGVILCDEDLDAEALTRLLETDRTAWLGRSRSAHYGRVRFEALQLEKDWRELDADLPVGDETLTMTLLSDLLLRAADNGSSQTTSLPGRELVAPDDVTLSAALGFAVDLVRDRCATATTLAGSYNATAHLPGVQRHGLRAGSVLTLRPTAPVSPAALAAVEWAGVGERRAEGFGRVAFGWPLGAELRIGRATGYRAPTSSIRSALSPAAERLATLMAARLLEQQIDEQIGLFVRDQVIQKQDVVEAMPRSSQLGRVRVLIRRALPSADVAGVRAGLADLKRAAGEQFERARIAGQPLDRWLDTLLADPPAGAAAHVWRVLDLDPGSTQVAGTRAPVPERLARLTALRLAEATLAAAARQRRREVAK